MAAAVDWSMGSRAALLADWGTAGEVGRWVAGPGLRLAAVERARLREDFAELVPYGESLIVEFTGMASDGLRSRPWVMSRGEWLDQNLQGLQRLMEPLAARILGERPSRSELRRKALGAQVGALLGYISRKVLGQYDVFLPPDDEGLLYFVGSNVVEVERRFHLPSRDFRLWISLHEVAHRVQFGAAPWLRGYLSSLVDAYLKTVQVDARELLRQLRRAAEEVRAGGEWRGVGVLFLLMTPEQRDLFGRMQAVMSVLEGHASFVMNAVGAGRVRDLPRMRRALRARRRATGIERSFQRAIGFESKVRQYDVGERFVRLVVDRTGMRGLNRVWQGAANLPTLAEVSSPEDWVARVAGA